MYYRVFAENPNVYPGYGYNLKDNELNQMAIWYLNSLYEQLAESEFNDKKDLFESANEIEIINQIENYLSNFDGSLSVERSETPFEESDCDDFDEMNNRPWN